MRKTNALKLKQIREDAGLTQEQLATSAGISLSSVKLAETGRIDPSIASAKKIAFALNVDVHDFYNEHRKQTKTKVITFLNNKGGAGKTTVCSNTAYAIAEMGYKILLIDADAQSSLTRAIEFDEEKLGGVNQLMVRAEKSINHALRELKPFEQYIVPTANERIDMILGNMGLGTIDSWFVFQTQRELLIKQSISSIIESGVYDFIIFDTNPVLGEMMSSILTASDHLIIPVIPEQFGKDGLEIVVDFIRFIKDKLNPELNILGIVLNRINKREKLQAELITEIHELFGDVRVFNTQIPQDANIGKSQRYSKVVISYNKSTKASKQFNALAQEVIECL